jgi:hypothetical protein
MPISIKPPNIISLSKKIIFANPFFKVLLLLTTLRQGTWKIDFQNIVRDVAQPG